MDLPLPFVSMHIWLCMVGWLSKTLTFHLPASLTWSHPSQPNHYDFMSVLTLFKWFLSTPSCSLCLRLRKLVQTYIFTHTHTHMQTLLGADNISCNLQTYCVERRSPVAFRVESTPAPSLSNIFSCFSATKSLLFSTNDQAILNVYTIHLRLNRYVYSALARSLFFHLLLCGD